MKKGVSILIIVALVLLPLASFASQPSKISPSTISKAVYLATGYLPEDLKILQAKGEFYGKEIAGTYLVLGKSVELKITKGIKDLEKEKLTRAIERLFESLNIPEKMIHGVNVTSLEISYLRGSSSSSTPPEIPVITVNLSFDFSLIGSSGTIFEKAKLQYAIPTENQSDELLIWAEICGSRGEIVLPVNSLDSIGVGASKLANILSEVGAKGNLAEVILEKGYFERAQFYSQVLKQEMSTPEVIVKGVSEISLGSAKALEISLKNGKLLKGSFQISEQKLNSSFRETALKLLYLIGKEYGSLMGSEVAKGLINSEEVSYDGNTFYLEFKNSTSGETLKIASQGPSPFSFSASLFRAGNGEEIKANFEVLNWTEFYPIKEIITPQMSKREAYFIALSALNLTIYQVGDWKASLRSYVWDDEEYQYYSVEMMVRTSNGEAIPTLVYVSPSGSVIKVSQLPPTCVLPPYMGPVLAAITIGVLGATVGALYHRRRGRPLLLIL